MTKPTAKMAVPRAITEGGDTRRLVSRALPEIEVLDGNLSPVRFGKFLITENTITRQELFCAMQLQDRHPGVRIGECAAALGFLGLGEVEELYAVFIGRARRRR